MQENQLYEYAIIRVVPKVEREEFLNVGVIVFSKMKKYLKVKYHIDPAKLTAFSEDIDITEISDYLRTWELISSGSSKGGEIALLDLPGRYRWLTATRSTIIQSSKSHPGRCNQPDEVLEDLFRKYVL